LLRKPFFLLAALLGVALVTTACGDDVTEPVTPTAALAIRAVHASPVDIGTVSGGTIDAVVFGNCCLRHQSRRHV
jgi:hypothetical protein